MTATRRRLATRPGNRCSIRPNYPDYTSGANNVAGALTRTLELFFGTDHMTFTVVSQHPLADPNTRTYHRFSDLSWDTVDVRIYQGIHFRFADEEGRKQGRPWPSGSSATSCNPSTKAISGKDFPSSIPSPLMGEGEGGGERAA